MLTPGAGYARLMRYTLDGRGGPLPDSIPNELDQLWHELNRDPRVVGWDVTSVTRGIECYYSSLDEEAQTAARLEFGRWLNSDDAQRRWDGAVLVRRLSIQEALPELTLRVQRLTRELDLLGDSLDGQARHRRFVIESELKSLTRLQDIIERPD